MEKEQKPVLFSGIQPSGKITLGNYLGAIKNFLGFAENYSCLFSMADLHALTVRKVPAELRRSTQELAALYIAAGLDPEKNIIFCQSHVPQHAELAWILNCYTYMGELSRMTQFKDKSKKHEDNINAGLFIYPVLMAADILLYQTELVPVGQDQKQHLELARDIGIRFNNIYGDVFKIPEGFIPKQGAKIMSLTEPTKKMSKSDEDENSMICVLDSKEDIARKIKRAVTDSETDIRFDFEAKPGVSNLLSICACASGKTIEETVKHFEGASYGSLKQETSDAVIACLEPIQNEYKRLIADKAYLSETLCRNAERAQQLAIRTLRKVYKKVGLYQG